MTKPGSKVFYYPLVLKKDIPRLGAEQAKQIKQAIQNKLAIQPEMYGLPLRGNLKQYWKLRVGDYRIVFKIFPEEVHIFAIAHRKEVYGIINKRI